MKKLSDVDARIVAALLQEHDKAIAAIDGYVAYLAQRSNMGRCDVKIAPDGMYLVEAKDEGDPGAASGDPAPVVGG